MALAPAQAPGEAPVVVPPQDACGINHEGAAPPGAIREGRAEVLPNCRRKEKDGKDEVFYNPAQVFNRDLSVLVLSVFAKIRSTEAEDKRRKREQRAQERGVLARESPPPGLKILEALAATGIRSIRYAKELGKGAEGVRLIVANDFDETAVAHIRRNVAHNAVPDGRIEVTCEDAARHMYAHRARGTGGDGDFAYDVIDVDPYGTAAPFLDAAVQAVADGGLLCITSTDMPILGGNNPETCFARYGGTALKNGAYVHEMALRLLVNAVASAAAKYGREARPVLSCSIDFYVRIFVRVFDSAARAKLHASKTGIVYQCVQCESFTVQPLGDVIGEENPKFKPARAVGPGADCPECGGHVKLGGPFYIGPLYDDAFARACLEASQDDHCVSRLSGVTSWKKITGMLTAICEEHADLVLYYRMPALCKGLKLTPIPLRQFRGTLVSLGYRVSHFHREADAIKTNAPNAVIYDLLRIWAEENPPKNVQLPELLKKKITLERPFEWRAEEEGAKTKVARFLPNPEANWGPKARARGGRGGEEEGEAAGEAHPSSTPLVLGVAPLPPAAGLQGAPLPSAVDLPCEGADAIACVGDGLGHEPPGREPNEEERLGACAMEDPPAKRQRTGGSVAVPTEEACA